MPTGSAFPTIEATRHISDHGLTAHEFATIVALPALITLSGLGADPAHVAALARVYADAALAHRRASA